MTKKRYVAGIMLLLGLGICFSGQAQTKAEAIDAYNKGVNIYESDIPGGIAAFESCIKISDQVGADADSIKLLATKILPELYFRKAAALYGDKKYPESAAAFQEAIKVADKYSDTNVKEKSLSNLPNIYYVMGAGDYGKKDYASAIANMNKALEYDPNFAKAYYVLAVIYRAQKDKDNMEKAIDKAIETAQASSDQSTANKAQNLGKATFYNDFVVLTKANKTEDAIKSLLVAIKYDPENKDYYFYLGSAYNKVKEYDNALTSLNKALEMDSSATPEAKARYYYEIATAQAGKGDKSAACEAYKNAEYGVYTDQAKYQRATVLKCE